MQREVNEMKTTIVATCSPIFKATVHSIYIFQRGSVTVQKVQLTIKPHNTGVITFPVNMDERTSHANGDRLLGAKKCTLSRVFVEIDYSPESSRLCFCDNFADKCVLFVASSITVVERSFKVVGFQQVSSFLSD